MSYKKTDLTIISEPSYVKIYCPNCDSEIEIEYWGDWEGELVYCEDCGCYFKIDNVVYD